MRPKIVGWITWHSLNGWDTIQASTYIKTEFIACAKKFTSVTGTLTVRKKWQMIHWLDSPKKCIHKFNCNDTNHYVICPNKLSSQQMTSSMRCCARPSKFWMVSAFYSILTHFLHRKVGEKKNIISTLWIEMHFNTKYLCNFAEHAI